jgi:indolepyruvate ferredoxin oxidoreductase alpha subunit
LNDSWTGLGIITTGIARNYYYENIDDLEHRPSHLHIGAYPMPAEKIRELAAHVDRLLVLEEGYPYVERFLRGIIPPRIEINGRMDESLPESGDLTPSIVRGALGLEIPESIEIKGLRLPTRPPQLCSGCPHRDSYDAISKAVSSYEQAMVTSDIGCYTLGALPPYSAIETCLCMGASIGIAKGAAEAGFHPVVAVIGDSTFLHSGVTPLMDAVSANVDMTLVILDNETVAMTGTQPTILPHTRLKDILLGVGVPEEHVHVFYAHPKKVDEHAEVIAREIEHKGLSVIVMVRECLESARRKKQEARKPV